MFLSREVCKGGGSEDGGEQSARDAVWTMYALRNKGWRTRRCVMISLLCSYGVERCRREESSDGVAWWLVKTYKRSVSQIAKGVSLIVAKSPFISG
jgi:hypothetical protein